jgi:bifunctional DNase/RNase
MVEVTVSRLGLDSTTNSYVVILRERGGRRLLPIWIGQPEAESIVMHMNQIKRERPITHDLCRSLIMALGGTLRRVTITHVQKNTYFAELQVEGPNGVVQVDARPSDSIAIALRLDAPIFAPELLLTAIEDDDDEGDGDEAFGGATGTSRPEASDTLSADELQRYLGSLRPEDFGRFTP